jgi:hypothetical protein
MAKFGYLVSGVLAATSATSVASAQEVTASGGAVAGTILSASVEVDPGATATIITVPENGRFVLTLICARLVREIPFSGSTFGFIAQTPPDGTYCQSLLPGVALNPGEDITCSAPERAINCQASGVLSKHQGARSGDLP